MDEILGRSSQIEALRAQIQRLAAFDAPGSPHVPTVLLEGETGSGKGLVARVMHARGPRAGGPFIDVNCAAIPEAMVEAELFGFEAGAFTDARRAKPGLFEAASGGTLFLDEIDSLSPPVQSKVLKAIEEKQVRRLGSVEPLSVDAKLIAATQADLEGQVASGAFRPDLYHRLAVLVLRIPALRERAGDPTLLAEHFLAVYSAAHGLAPKRFTAEARSWLESHAWPGNVRELAHLIERVIFLCPDDEVGADALQQHCIRIAPRGVARIATIAPTMTEDRTADDEAERVRAALGRTGGNVVRAARLLGIGRNALRYRMRRLGIDRSGELEVEPPEAEAAPPRASERRPARAPVAVPPSAAGPAAWEPKPVVILALSLTLPEIEDRRPADHEPWTAARRWESAIVDRVGGFGGTIVQKSPGRLTAVFGVPRALEQTPERAVQAALAIARAAHSGAGVRPEMRAAVHAGEVRVDVRAVDPLDGLLPVGDLFALPERLLGHAGGGEVLASAPIARRVGRSCRLEQRVVQLGPAAADRAIVYRVMGPRAPAQPASALESGATRFVGREREVDTLADAFERAACGQGQVIFVAGDAGIGKSRLLAEFRQRVQDRPHRWFEGRCASYGTGTPFLPIIDGMRRFYAIDDTDDEASAGAKIEQAVQGVGAGLEWTLPFVRQILSLGAGDEAVHDLDSASRRSELFRALRVLTMRAAEREPVILLFEDLHWIDPASEEFLAFIGDAVPTGRILLILSHRTGYSQPFGDRSFHQRITLAPLTGAHVSAMTGSIFDGAEIPAEVGTLIAAKAEGNPFFVEELARSLLEDGSLRRENGRVALARELAEIAVPDSIQDVLIARIDRLAEDSRQAIQIAAVIGREFALRLLARIVEAGESVRTRVDELRQMELIYEKALHPELAYMFKHALTHDVAYESVGGERRRALHRTIGLAIEELYADRLIEHYETLAHHFGRAEDWERALRYCELSADKAASTHANRAVVEHCRRGLEILAAMGGGQRDAEHLGLYLRLARAHFFLSEFAAAGVAYEQAAGRATGDEERALHLSAGGYGYFWGHRYDDAWRVADAALALAEQANAPAARAHALTARAFYRVVHGADIRELADDSAEALALCIAAANRPVEAFARVHLFQSAEWAGDYGRAIAEAERTIALGRELRAPECIILANWFLGKALCCTGDFGRALALLDEADALCERVGDRAWRSRILNTLGWCYAEIGCFERARDHNERAAVLARELGDPEILSNASINLAADYLALGDRERALEHLEPIESALARPGDPWMRWRYALHAQDLRAELELGRGEPEKALAALAAELTGARRHRVPKAEARALRVQAAVMLATDQRPEAMEALRASLAIAERIGYRRGIWQAHRLLAECERRNGRSPAAQAHAATAVAAAEQAARTLSDDALRRELLASVRPLAGG